VANAWPSTTTVRKTLPDIHSSELELLKNSMKGKKIAIFADETTDCEQRYVLNVLILDLDFTKASKPLLAETFFLEVKYHKTVTFLIYIKLLLLGNKSCKNFPFQLQSCTKFVPNFHLIEIFHSQDKSLNYSECKYKHLYHD
jgi:hypothetical protein